MFNFKLGKRPLIAFATTAILASPAHAVSDADWAAMKSEIGQMKASYEARIAELEARVKAAEDKTDAVQQTAQAAMAPPPAAPARSNSFNPDISMVLDGRYANLGKPASTQIGGFLTPAGQDRPPKGFSVDGTEISLAANIDPMFKGFANIVVADEAVEVEEAWFQTLGLGNGFNIKGGRFISAMGYQNEQHAHAWDFADNNLVYKTLFGEHYVQDGLQIKWLAPTDLLIEPFLEIGRGANFPGTDRDVNGAGSVTAGVPAIAALTALILLAWISPAISVATPKYGWPILSGSGRPTVIRTSTTSNSRLNISIATSRARSTAMVLAALALAA
jgi:hypothetical protein